MTTTVQRRTARVGAGALAAILGLAALTTAAPAFADQGTWLTGAGGSATVSVADNVTVGDAIHLEGSGWTAPDGAGSWIAVKLGAAGGVEADVLTVEPAAGRYTFPGAGSSTAAIWTGIQADADGGFSVDVPFPTPATTSPALAAAWAPGSTHHLQLLSGSMKPGGDTPRSVYVTFTVTADTVTVNASAGGRGAPADQVTLSVAAAAGTFAAGEALTATVDGADKAWTAGGTASATGALTGSTLVFAPGTLRAGAHTVTLTGPTSGTITRAVTTAPAATFSALAQGASGSLTLKNLPAGSTVASVAFEGADVAFTGLPAAADTAGATTVAYSIAADAALGTHPVAVTLANPAGTFDLPGQKISPDSSPVGGEDRFTLTSNGDGIAQGLYQSAYSAAEDALFATAAAGTGAAEDGYLYKVDPDTLAVLGSVHPKDVTDPSGAAGLAPYGIGVDDVHGTVWVTNTRTNAVAVYSAADLTLLKQHPAGTVTHSRDVVYDPRSDRVFVSSASEGTTGDGSIAVFEGGDNDGDGTPYEKITDIPTGPRAEYSPMSLALSDGVLVSPSLSSNKVVKVDTTTLQTSFLTVEGIDVGGRGASGIAYDAAANRLWIASQNSDDVVIADATTGATLAEIPTGAGALNTAFDPVHHLVYVTNFGGTTVTVLEADGTKVANLPIARANHVSVDGLGNAYVVDKATGNKVWKISAGDAGPGEPGQPGEEGGSSAVEVLVEIPAAGGLTLSVGGATADLGTAELDATAEAFVADGTLPTVTVADVRTADVGWNLVGQVSDFTSGAATFPGSALGWTPSVLSASPGQVVAAGAAKATGLDVTSPLASAAAGTGRGTAKVAAGLTLRAPTTVTPGGYAAVLTLTLS
ncbi:hypothetical protein [Xylanimonas protaetiae]|uniref:hypothetical protein n=1 Tax=Xylanimonas protaetiae TaxID=2509457 RepID=UPI0013EAEA41|nr:hypothetical protein [Xylanimonas protaetiae]